MNYLWVLAFLILLTGCDKYLKFPLSGRASTLPVGAHQVVGAGQSNMWYMRLETQFAPFVHTNVGTTNIAVPGTNLSQWDRGGDLHAKLIDTLKLRQPAVMLWWQGENDAYFHNEDTYGQRFTQFILNTRAESGLKDLIIIFVQLGRSDGPGNRGWDVVKAQQAMISLPGVYMVASEDVQQDPDGVHYVTSGGYDVMGKRLALEFNSVLGI